MTQHGCVRMAVPLADAEPMRHLLNATVSTGIGTRAGAGIVAAAALVNIEIPPCASAGRQQAVLCAHSILPTGQGSAAVARAFF